MTVFANTTKQVDGKKSVPFYRHYESTQDLIYLIDRCKALTTYVKHYDLQEELDKMIKQ